jgi:hypothetical protein
LTATNRKLDPRLYFLLCHHFKSSPYLFILEPETLPDILRKATSDYLNDHVEINVKTNEVKASAHFRLFLLLY